MSRARFGAVEKARAQFDVHCVKTLFNSRIAPLQALPKT
jgi:hypothetical protein